jgi:hypothetical protein
MAVTMKDAVFWDVVPHNSCEPTFQRIVSPSSSGQLLAHAGSRSRIFLPKMEAIHSSKTSFHTRTTWHIPEDGILLKASIHTNTRNGVHMVV